MDTASLHVRSMKKRICCAHEKHKTGIKSRLKTKKNHKAIAFYQEVWLEPYIKMNTDLRKEAKNNFEKDF